MKSCNKNSETISEGLFGESFIIKKINDEWVYGRLKTDDYLGWMKVDDLGLMSEITHKIKVIRTSVLSEPYIKSSYKFYLPLGGLISASNYDENWLHIKYNENNINKEGFVFKKHTLKKNNKYEDWVNLAEQLIGTPYKWGGRDTLGLDCSALVQVCLSITNTKFPRDTKDQLNFKSREVNSIQNINRGDLIYWPGHVAIAQNSENLVHANAYYMKVSSEKIEKARDRIEKECGMFLKIKTIKTND